MKSIDRALAAACLLAAAAAQADYCAVSVVPVQFGSYLTISPVTVDAVGSVRVSCASGVMFTVRLDAGEARTFHPRRLYSLASEHTLGYNLYRDAARTQVWGDGTHNTFAQTGHSTGVEATLIVYGRLPGGQRVRPGQYRDALTVSVDW